MVPRTRLGEVLAEIERMSEESGIRAANVFHAGDGNLHPLILYDGRERGAVERAHELAGEILRLCIALGGSITGEHGIGLEKREYLSLMFSPDDVEMMHRMRRAIDPAELANRGKMLEVTEITSAAASRRCRRSCARRPAYACCRCGSIQAGAVEIERDDVDRLASVHRRHHRVRPRRAHDDGARGHAGA